VNRLVNRERSRRAAGPGEQMLVNMNSGFGDARGFEWTSVWQRLVSNVAHFDGHVVRRLR